MVLSKFTYYLSKNHDVDEKSSQQIRKYGVQCPDVLAICVVLFITNMLLIIDLLLILFKIDQIVIIITISNGILIKNALFLYASFRFPKPTGN